MACACKVSHEGTGGLSDKLSCGFAFLPSSCHGEVESEKSRADLAESIAKSRLLPRSSIAALCRGISGAISPSFPHSWMRPERSRSSSATDQESQGHCL